MLEKIYKTCIDRVLIKSWQNSGGVYMKLILDRVAIELSEEAGSAMDLN